MIHPLPDVAEADRLTTALRGSGALGQGRVSEVTVAGSLAKLRSLTLRLHLTYEGPAGEAPVSVILKSGRHGPNGEVFSDNGREIAFYRDLASAMPVQRPVPRCFDAVSHPDTKAWHLLLEDLTDTHVIATEWPLPPTTDQSGQIIRALAGFHAAWWDDPRLGTSIGHWRDAEALDRDLQRFDEQFTRFSDRFGEYLPPHRRQLYEHLRDQAPRLLGRLRSRRGLTVVHGDAHPWNCFLPRTEASEDVRLIDWENWNLGPATDDLAYMMAMLWYPDLRHRIEAALLDRYHATLLAHGVHQYTREALDMDYRLSVLWLITRPIRQAAAGVPPRVWWNNLERIHMAVDDLGCRELLVG